MTSPTGQKTPVIQPAYQGHEFEALKLRYEDHVELLRTLTALDLQIFTGYITVQVVLGGWLTQYPVRDILLKIGLVLIDLTLSGVAGWLLYNNYKRRTEVVGTIKNLNDALGFTKPDIYLQGKAINAPTTFRPWVYGYLVGVVAGAVGVGLIILASPATGNTVSTTATPTIAPATPTAIPATSTPMAQLSETPNVIPLTQLRDRRNIHASRKFSQHTVSHSGAWANTGLQATLLRYALQRA